MKTYRRHRLKIDGRIIAAAVLVFGLVVWVALVLFVRELVNQP
jgi:uncharacterized membrane protein